jgi:hypothetical protein
VEIISKPVELRPVTVKRSAFTGRRSLQAIATPSTAATRHRTPLMRVKSRGNMALLHYHLYREDATVKDQQIRPVTSSVIPETASSHFIGNSTRPLTAGELGCLRNQQYRGIQPVGLSLLPCASTDAAVVDCGFNPFVTAQELVRRWDNEALLNDRRSSATSVRTKSSLETGLPFIKQDSINLKVPPRSISAFEFRHACEFRPRQFLTAYVDENSLGHEISLPMSSDKMDGHYNWLGSKRLTGLSKAQARRNDDGHNSLVKWMIDN